MLRYIYLESFVLMTLFHSSLVVVRLVVQVVSLPGLRLPPAGKQTWLGLDFCWQ